MSSLPTWSTGLIVAGASAAKAGATTTSVGSGIAAPRAWAAATIWRAVSSRSSSTSDLPTLWPAAAMKVLAMPPPTISWSTLPTSEESSSSLVETLEPATMASSGRAGCSSALASASSSAISSGPPAATGAKRITPWVEAWARWAVPKASMTNTSHSAAYFFDSASSSLFSPTFMRQFSSSTTWPAATSTPSTQSRSSGTSTPSSSDRRLATGASESVPLHTPSFGRPRCEVTMTAAPFSRASLMVGSEAVMRCSEVITPASLIGTLRSWRISTRLPARSRSVMRRMDMAGTAPREWKTPIVPCPPDGGKPSRRPGRARPGPCRHRPAGPYTSGGASCTLT